MQQLSFANHSVRVLLATVLTALGACGLSACGTSSVSTNGYSGEQKAVAQRISDFQSDATSIDQKKVCQEDLAASVLAKLKTAGSDCEMALKHQLEQIDIVELKIHSITVSKKTASAVVESTWSGKTRKSTLLLTKEGSAWKITGLGAA
jgi:hypothetical protein